ncbi:hypothetical protein BJ138DRAFT_972063, partial [Hygrophoropsis aurantiaca]
PRWLSEVVEYLKCMDDSDEWVDLVMKLVDLDRRLAFPKGMGKSCILTANRRPAELSTWIKSGRDYSKCPSIESSKAFGESFMDWWFHLQPSWRHASDGSLLTELPDGEVVWTELAKGSVNGFAMILVALAGWW